MRQPNDWRLMGQERYLKGTTLAYRAYRPNPGNDHDHCEFCTAKFMQSDSLPDVLHEGYSTLDGYRWICKTCFEDFLDLFDWIVQPHTET